MLLRAEGFEQRRAERGEGGDQGGEQTDGGDDDEQGREGDDGERMGALGQGGADGDERAEGADEEAGGGQARDSEGHDSYDFALRIADGAKEREFAAAFEDVAKKDGGEADGGPINSPRAPRAWKVER